MKSNIIRNLALPLLLLAVFLSLFFLWKFLNLPEDQELITLTRNYFERYGLVTVFVSAVLEGMLLIGLYYPGSIVIFLGVILAGKNISKVIEVVAIATSGLYIGYVLDYLLGKYGWYRLLLVFGLKGQIENAERRLTRHGLGAIFVSYWHPNFAAIISTAAGILHFSPRKFLLYSLLAVTVWNIFWGTLAYLLGEATIALMGIRFAIIVVVVWILFAITKTKIKTESEIGKF